MAMMGDKKKVKDMMLENRDIIQENTSKRLFRKKIWSQDMLNSFREFFNIIDKKQSDSSINMIKTISLPKELPPPTRWR